MRHWLSKFFVVFLLGQPLLSVNGADAPASDVVNKVMTQLHTKQQLEGIANFAIAELDLRKDVLDTKDYQQLKAMMSTAFDANSLHHDVTQSWQKQSNDKMFIQWLARLQSPLFVKMSRLEQQASSDAEFKGMLAFAEDLKAKPATPARQKLIARLDGVTAGGELALRGQLAVLGAFLKAINPSLPTNKQLSETKLQKILDSTRAQIEPSIHEIALLTHLYTYRSVSDEDLRAYIALYESEPGKWFMQLNRESIMSALASASQRATKLIEQHLRSGNAA